LTNTFLNTFNQFKVVICICPKCNALSRLSDLLLSSKEKVPKTWLDNYDVAKQKIEDREADFEEKEDLIRKEAIIRGRAKVPKIIRKSMNTQFTKLNYDPYDIKPILYPVEFVIFNGMNKGELKNISLLSRKSKSPIIHNLQENVAEVIDKKLYDWKVLRVSIKGDISYE
jgi:predicted Holliday junction resolvase-like endonuclease|tara:strand:- start:714 stop:1223 length:510 start_codon:yes stop_codon:yes gene_type:complete